MYLTPPGDPLNGVPIGNGKVGALCWFDDSKIMIVINRSDLWDAKQEERCTTLRHGGRIIIDFKAPMFDLIYLSDCNGRIGPADGSVRGRTSSLRHARSHEWHICAGLPGSRRGLAVDYRRES